MDNFCLCATCLAPTSLVFTITTSVVFSAVFVSFVVSLPIVVSTKHFFILLKYSSSIVTSLFSGAMKNGQDDQPALTSADPPEGSPRQVLPTPLPSILSAPDTAALLNQLPLNVTAGTMHQIMDHMATLEDENCARRVIVDSLPPAKHTRTTQASPGRHYTLMACPWFVAWHFSGGFSFLIVPSPHSSLGLPDLHASLSEFGSLLDIPSHYPQMVDAAKFTFNLPGIEVSMLTNIITECSPLTSPAQLRVGVPSSSMPLIGLAGHH